MRAPVETGLPGLCNLRVEEKRLVIVAETEWDQLCVECNTVHALVIFVGGENAGHLGTVTHPVEGAGAILDIVKTGVSDSSLKFRQVAVQA